MSATKPRPRSIVVAIDFAEMTDVVLDASIEQARLSDAAVVHVACALNPKSAITIDDKLVVYELDGLERAMSKRVAARMSAAGVPYEVHAVLGRAASTIADLARELRAELIVVGRHNGGRQAFAGSVPAELLNIAHCSVLVAQPPDYGEPPAVL